MWEQDYCLNPEEDDFFTDIFPEESFSVDDMDETSVDQSTEPEGRPFWQVRVEYSNHMVQDISCYEDYLPERPEELYFSLLEYLQSEDELF